MVREVRGCFVVEINHVGEINGRLNLLILTELPVGRSQIGKIDAAERVVLATDRLGVLHRGRNEVIEVEVLDVEGLHHVGTAGLQELPDLVLIPVAAERGLHRVRRSRHLAECQCRCKHFDEKRFHPIANSNQPDH